MPESLPGNRRQRCTRGEIRRKLLWASQGEGGTPRSYVNSPETSSKKNKREREGSSRHEDRVLGGRKRSKGVGKQWKLKEGSGYRRLLGRKRRRDIIGQLKSRRLKERNLKIEHKAKGQFGSREGSQGDSSQCRTQKNSISATRHAGAGQNTGKGRGKREKRNPA